MARVVPAVMLQGTGSNVGKSTLVAGLCRALTRRGLKVMPFKPQNMSNNAAATADGGEIGRAQALQAIAAKVPASVHMNPVLLKPESETGSQVIVQGRRSGSLTARDFRHQRAGLLPHILESFDRVSENADIVLVEGAGSPAEVNLRAGDIANMGFALAARVPVVLVGDIDRGGVIASLVGTHAVLDPQERTLIRGFAVNKFRGDAALFADGMAIIAERTGWAPLGIAPWFPMASRLPAEDAADLEKQGTGRPAKLRIAVPRLSRISNFDDFDPLAQEPDVSLRFVAPGEALPGDADLIILPGTKSTIADLAFFRSQGWDIDLRAHVRRGGHVLGLCGGYQILGQSISDPDGLEGEQRHAEGLGLLDVQTVLGGDKVVQPVMARHIATGEEVIGYEIHLGQTQGVDCSRPIVEIEGRPDGAQSSDGRISGTYVHGLFSADSFRRAFLARFGMTSDLAYAASIEATLDTLADHCERHLDIDALLAIARSRVSLF